MYALLVHYLALAPNIGTHYLHAMKKVPVNFGSARWSQFGHVGCHTVGIRGNLYTLFFTR